jgi:hypothetical protein
MLPCVSWLRTRLPARDSSGATLCPVALDPASLLGRASALPQVPWLRILPPYLGGLRRYHISHGFGSCLPTREGSGIVTCPTAPDPASLLGRAPALSCVP